MEKTFAGKLSHRFQTIPPYRFNTNPKMIYILNFASLKSQDIEGPNAAKASEDYYPQVDVPVVFKAGDLAREVEIKINDDSEQENDETFKLSLTCDNPDCVKVNSAVVSITDDDGKNEYQAGYRPIE